MAWTLASASADDPIACRQILVIGKLTITFFMTSHQHLPANHLRVQHHHKREKCDGNDAALHSACELRLGACLRQSVKAQHGASQIYSTMWLESSVVIRAISSVCFYPVECSLSSSCTRILPVIRSVFLFSEPCCMLHVFVPPALSRTQTPPPKLPPLLSSLRIRTGDCIVRPFLAKRTSCAG